MNHKNTQVVTLKLFVSVMRNIASYEIVCPGDIFIGHIADPLDFVAEMQPLIDDKRLDFTSCKVLLETDAASVNRNFTAPVIPDHVTGHHKICILETDYEDLFSHKVYTLPVQQHCMGFFDLYLNAVRYIKTIAETA